MDHERLTYLALYEGDKMAAAELERRRQERNSQREPHAAYSTPEVQITVTLPAGDEPAYSEEPPTEADLAKAILTIQRHAARNRANAEIKRLLCMAHETYDPAALDALTRALIAQGFGK